MRRFYCIQIYLGRSYNNFYARAENRTEALNSLVDTISHNEFWRDKVEQATRIKVNYVGEV